LVFIYQDLTQRRNHGRLAKSLVLALCRPEIEVRNLVGTLNFRAPPCGGGPAVAENSERGSKPLIGGLGCSIERHTASGKLPEADSALGVSTIIGRQRRLDVGRRQRRIRQ